MSEIFNRKQKIHIVGSNASGGGVYTYILNIFKIDNVNIFIYKYRDFFKFFNNLNSGDIVFLNVVKPSLPFLLISCLFGKNKLKLIYCGHGMNYNNNFGLKRVIVRICERLIVKLVNKVIVLNEIDMDETLSINSNSYYLPTYLKPIGLNYNKNPITNQLNWVSVGSVEDRKDPYEFIKISNRVLKNHPSDTFTWIGEGPLFEEIQSKNIDVRIKFIGKIDNIKLRKTIVSSDVFLCTSNFEVLPISILEAVEAGLILVVRNYHYSDEITKMFKSCYIYKSVEQVIELRSDIKELQLLRDFSLEEAQNIDIRYEKYKNTITNIIYND